MLTAKEAAQRLRISLSLMYRLIEQKRMPCVRIGGVGCRGKILVREEDVKKFLESVAVG